MAYIFIETIQNTFTLDALKCGVNEIVDEKIVSNKHYEKLNFFHRLFSKRCASMSNHIEKIELNVLLTQRNVLNSIIFCNALFGFLNECHEIIERSSA